MTLVDGQGDEPAPCEIDDRARGRIMTHLLNVAPLDGAGVSDDVSDREYRSLFGTIVETLHRGSQNM